MEENRLMYLLELALNGHITEEERAELNEQLSLPENELLAKRLFDQAFERSKETVDISPEKQEKILQTIYAADEPQISKTTRIWPRIAIAASILIALCIGAYLITKQTPNQQLAQIQPEQIEPANKGVTLSLGKGQIITLSQTHQGQIATLNGTQINQSDSMLHYQGTPSVSTVPVTNTLTNNSGKQFRVTLADGTEATLDIASSITYPVAFTESERKVSVIGQVYFKVKHIASQVFKVTTQNQVIEDIGTEFNIDSYPNETITKTTLIEGAISVASTKNSKKIRLQPGEQAIIAPYNIHVEEANLEEATAWLQSKLIFHHETLGNIMKQVSRIYDVEVIWVDDVRDLKFGGSVSRSKKLSTVLNFFRKAGKVDFKVEGRTVKVFKRK